MKKANKLLILLLICLLLCSCSANYGGEGLVGQSAKDFALKEQGYSLTLPENWQQQQTKDEKTTSFLSDDGSIKLDIVCELGGVEYYSLAEVAQLLEDQLAKGMKNSEVVSTKDDDQKQYREVFACVDDQGRGVTYDISIIHPYNSLRYFLIFTSGTNNYQENSLLIDDIINSFKVTAGEEDMYAQIKQ